MPASGARSERLRANCRSILCPSSGPGSGPEARGVGSSRHPRDRGLDGPRPAGAPTRACHRAAPARRAVVERTAVSLSRPSGSNGRPRPRCTPLVGFRQARKLRIVDDETAVRRGVGPPMRAVLGPRARDRRSRKRLTEQRRRGRSAGSGRPNGAPRASGSLRLVGPVRGRSASRTAPARLRSDEAVGRPVARRPGGRGRCYRNRAGSFAATPDGRSIGPRTSDASSRSASGTVSQPQPVRFSAWPTTRAPGGSAAAAGTCSIPSPRPVAGHARRWCVLRRVPDRGALSPSWRRRCCGPGVVGSGPGPTAPRSSHGRPTTSSATAPQLASGQPRWWRAGAADGRACSLIEDDGARRVRRWPASSHAPGRGERGARIDRFAAPVDRDRVFRLVLAALPFLDIEQQSNGAHNCRRRSRVRIETERRASEQRLDRTTFSRARRDRVLAPRACQVGRPALPCSERSRGLVPADRCGARRSPARDEIAPLGGRGAQPVAAGLGGAPAGAPTRATSGRGAIGQAALVTAATGNFRRLSVCRLDFAPGGRRGGSPASAAERRPGDPVAAPRATAPVGAISDRVGRPSDPRGPPGTSRDGRGRRARRGNPCAARRGWSGWPAGERIGRVGPDPGDRRRPVRGGPAHQEK